MLLRTQVVASLKFDKKIDSPCTITTPFKDNAFLSYSKEMVARETADGGQSFIGRKIDPGHIPLVVLAHVFPVQ